MSITVQMGSIQGRADSIHEAEHTYDPVNHTYLGLGEKVGNAFKDGLRLK